MTKDSRSFLSPAWRDFLLPGAAVFLLYFLSGKLGQFMFFNLNTSPAVVWPPVGIALAAIYLGGYRFVAPVMAGQLLISATSPANPSLALILFTSIAYSSQPALGAYLLRRFGFVGSFSNARDALVFLGVAFTVPLLAPALITLAQVATDALAASPWANLTRAWAGGVMSALVVVPLITPWFIRLSSPLRRTELAETALALGFVVLMTYIVFWTALPRINVFFVLFFLFVALFWVGLRARPRFMALALFLVASLGILGSIVARPMQAPLGQQLFADELFVILVAPIFLILTGLVTERARALSQFAARTKELEGALMRLSKEDRAKTEFIATLAHELRNPLSPVMSTLELLQLSKIPQELRVLAESAKQQTETMKRLLDDLLDAARLSQQNLILRKESIELKELVRRSVASVHKYLESKHHTLELALPYAPVWLEVDAVRLEQVLVNLLNNAAKYTDRYGLLRLWARRDGNTLSISVSDNGMGIEPGSFDSLFEPFGGAAGVRQRPGGLHLGLSLAKRMAELHGGALTVESEGLGKGSTFTLSLPLSAMPEPLRAAPPAQREVRRRKILVVDDNEAAAQGLGKLLEHHGHTVGLAYTGREALRALEQFKPEIILLDIELPDLSGYEVARRVRSSKSDCTLVALSGYGQESDRQRTKEMGFSHHITKPVGIAELQNLIGALPAR